ncbi:MAG: SDR family oxidoreductase [Candidatus Limnocylindrales bacterium]
MADVLAGRHALVTGASSGVGRAIALALAENGAFVWATGRRIDELVRLAAQAPGDRITPLPGDLARPADMARIVEQVRRGGRLDILIHAAAVYAHGPVTELGTRELDEMLAINVVAPHDLTRSLLPLLSTSHGGIVFLNSSVSLTTGSGPSGYAASKQALRGYVDVLRREVNADGIKVCSLFLGRTATPLQERLHATEGRRYDPDRLIQPTDVAGVVVFLLTLPDSVELTDVSLRPMRPPLDA